MGLIGGIAGYHLLKRINPGGTRNSCSGTAYDERSKMESLFGPTIWSDLRDRLVIDFGCGVGTEAIEMARRGARRVIGIDIREGVLKVGREAAQAANLSDRCVFVTQTSEVADVVVSLDAFEHFSDPAGILRIMRGLVGDEGRALIVFGPTWYHPYGGHLFSVFPWAHLLFTERALIRWRSDFKTDGAKRFCEVEGGLNQMTIRRFKALVSQSEWAFESCDLVPIRGLQHLANAFTQEFTTAVVRCRLRPRLPTSGRNA